MNTSSRFKFPKTVVTAITVLYLILMVLTYVLYYKEPFKVCGQGLLIAQSFALVFQLLLNYVNHRSKEKIVILTTLFVGAMLFFGLLSAFINLELLCKFRAL